MKKLTITEGVGVLRYRKQGEKEAAAVARKVKTAFDAAAAATMTSAEIAAYMDEKTRRFAEEFNVDMNGTQAAIRAGYKPGANNASAAHRAMVLLRDPRVKAYRVALIRESVEDMTLTKDSLVLKLLEVYQRCMAATPVLQYDSATKSWEPSGEWQFDAKGATRALQQLSKMLGYDEPVKLENGEGGVLRVAFEQESEDDGG